jgi:dTDP-glucose 4,6-dehydratase
LHLLITGGAGFIGSHFVRYIVNHHPDDHCVVLDSLTYAGSMNNLKAITGKANWTFIKGDIADASLVSSILSGEKGRQPIDAVVHFAAESHVDRSIKEPHPFIRTNIVGTHVLLESARRYGVKRFIQISTDEVYGSLGPAGSFAENSPLSPNNPYAASKASADLLALSYWRTYRLPVIITRSTNNYGSHQNPEKLIPLAVTRALADEPVTIYGDGQHTRDWVHVEDHCRAIDLALRKGENGEIYNIGANNEWTNLELVKLILKLLNKDESLITFVADRPGHDRRYAIDSTKIQTQLGWKPTKNFLLGLKETINWYRKHQNDWRLD